jgi:hypothetical protein
MSATLQDRAYALLGSSNGQTAPQAHRNLDHQAVLPGTNIHDTKLPTMMATLQDQAHALVEGPAAILRKDLNADSHELAHQVPEVRGAVQTAQPSSNNAEVVRDIGWHKANVEIPDPLIGGYTNGELFQFIRRFNKVGLPRPIMLSKEKIIYRTDFDYVGCLRCQSCAYGNRTWSRP